MSYNLSFYFLTDIPPGSLCSVLICVGCSSALMLGIPFPESSVFLLAYALILLAYLFQKLPVKNEWRVNYFDSLVWLSMAQFYPYTRLKHSECWRLGWKSLSSVLQHCTSAFQIPLKLLRSHLSFWFLILVYVLFVSLSKLLGSITSFFIYRVGECWQVPNRDTGVIRQHTYQTATSL